MMNLWTDSWAIDRFFVLLALLGIYTISIEISAGLIQTNIRIDDRK